MRNVVQEFFHHVTIIFRPRRVKQNTGQSFWRFFRFALSRKKTKPREKIKPEVKWLKKTKLPDQGYGFLHFVSRALSYSPKKQTIPEKNANPLIEVLKQRPRFHLSELKRSFLSAWRYFVLLFSSAPKTEDLSKHPTLATRTGFLLRQDITNFISGLDPKVISKSVAKVCLGGVLFVVGFEFFLQLTTFLTWSMLEIKPKLGFGSQNVILFAGDSYAAGKMMSYKVKPYVHFVQDMVARSETQNKILRFGSEYLKAKDLEQELPFLLYKYRPDLVYIMVGVNDLSEQAGRSASLQPIQSESRKPGYFRTPFLLREWYQDRSLGSLLKTILSRPSFPWNDKMVDRNRVNFPAARISDLIREFRSPNFPYGEWYLNDTRVDFLETGEVNSRGEKGNYSIRDNVFAENTSAGEVLYIWNTKAGILTLSGSEPYDIREYNKKPQSAVQDLDAHLASAWWNLEMGALDVAQDEFLLVLKKNPDEVFAHAGLAEVFYKLGEHGEAKKQIFWLMRRYQARPSLKNARALMHAFPLENPILETVNLAIEMLSVYPDDPWLWKSFSFGAFYSGQIDLANKAMTRATKQIPENMKETRADFLRNWATIQAHSNGQDSMKNNIEAFLLDNKERLFVQSIRINGASYLDINYRQVVNNLHCPVEQKKAIASLLTQALDVDFVRGLHAYSTHLKNLVAICKEYNARPVFLTYPLPQPEIEATIQRITEESDASWLNVSARFEILLKTRNRNQEIMKYGQLTGEAHRNIAKWIMADIQERAIPK